MDFTAFVLSQLPPPPRRVLEIGCGREGGVTPALVEDGYDALGVDPHAPDGERFRATRFEELDGERFDAVVGAHVLHHVHPLGPALDTLAGLAPLVVVEEFAWEQMDEPTRDWYEAQHRALRAAGVEPKGPPTWGEWEAKGFDLHASDTLRRELAKRFDERFFEWRPFLYRWLAGPSTLTLEEGLVSARAIKPLGCRWVGVSPTARPG